MDEIRLIDANALKQVIEDRYEKACLQKLTRKASEKQIHEGIALGTNFARNAIIDAPTVDAVPVVHAKWIPTHGGKMVNGHLLFADGVECSKCKKGHSGSNYCEECGAKMDGA